MAELSDEDFARLHLESVMRRLGHEVNAVINAGCEPGKPKSGFVLVTFPFGEVVGPAVNHITNAQRATMLAVLREVVESFQGQAEAPAGRA